MTTREEAIVMLREMEQRPDLINVQYQPKGHGDPGVLYNRMNLCISAYDAEEIIIQKIANAYTQFVQMVTKPSFFDVLFTSRPKP
jgi:hypothetical protein